MRPCRIQSDQSEERRQTARRWSLRWWCCLAVTPQRVPANSVLATSVLAVTAPAIALHPCVGWRGHACSCPVLMPGVSRRSGVASYWHCSRTTARATCVASACERTSSSAPIPRCLLATRSTSSFAPAPSSTGSSSYRCWPSDCSASRCATSCLRSIEPRRSVQPRLGVKLCLSVELRV